MCASDVSVAGGTPSEPEQHRAPGMSNRQRVALKREKPAGKPAIGATVSTALNIWSGGQ